MNLLIDSHCLLRWLADTPMTPEALEAIADSTNTVFVSTATIWELEIKAALGKLIVDGDLVVEVEDAGFTWLQISATHAKAAAHLPTHHRDPFDRMLIAQARTEGCTLISRDRIFDAYQVTLIEA